MVNSQILIVDDEPNIRVSLARALQLEDYATVEVASLSEARDWLRTNEPDLILLDLKLPDGQGIELLRERCTQDRETPVVMMSGHGTIDDAVTAIRLGASDFLEKPIGQDRVFLTIANALELSRLRRENENLRREREENQGGVEILGRSKKMVHLKAQIERVAQSEGRVLITGENGTGKELVALAIHRFSSRNEGPFVSLNCAAVPSELIESEFFGHEKGAFTGAISRKLGKFEQADGGTLFLDEVGDMASNMQAKLLRVLESACFERVGAQKEIQVDVRVLAATNKDLESEIEAGRFREDLYYRLNVVPLHTPPLRERKEDIPALVTRFLAHAGARNRRTVCKLSDQALALLADYDYPGNVRELRNLVERIVILAPSELDVLDRADIRAFVPKARAAAGAEYRSGVKLSDLVTESERTIVSQALEAHNGVVAEAARALGVERSNFHKKLKALGLR